MKGNKHQLIDHLKQKHNVSEFVTHMCHICGGIFSNDNEKNIHIIQVNYIFDISFYPKKTNRAFDTFLPNFYFTNKLHFIVIVNFLQMHPDAVSSAPAVAHAATSNSTSQKRTKFEDEAETSETDSATKTVQEKPATKEKLPIPAVCTLPGMQA